MSLHRVIKFFQSMKDYGESISKLRASSLKKLIENTQFIMISKTKICKE